LISKFGPFSKALMMFAVSLLNVIDYAYYNI